jgi:hypothetical protein
MIDAEIEVELISDADDRMIVVNMSNPIEVDLPMWGGGAHLVWLESRPRVLN